MKYNCAYDCKLTNLSKNGHLRTETVEGGCDILPAVGKRFIMVADSLTPQNDARLVTTTPIREVKSEPGNRLFEFWTMNTHYQLEVTDG
jgi:hypothetical protein